MSGGFLLNFFRGGILGLLIEGDYDGLLLLLLVLLLIVVKYTLVYGKSGEAGGDNEYYRRDPSILPRTTPARISWVSG